MRSSLLAALSVLSLVAHPAAGQVAGGGSKSSDCLAEFNAPVNVPAKKPKNVRCVDNDPTCDADPTSGVCQFQVEVCVNVSDPALPQCGPDRIDRFSVENVQPDTDARHDFDFQALEDAVNAFALPVTANQTDVCSGTVGIELVLPVQVGKRKAKYQKLKKKLRTHARGRSDDSDKLDMQCLPDKATSPCDNVTSTFDQIQRHILTPGCGRDTCHSSVGPLHDLSFAPGETLGFLVGVAPNNADADAAGKLRVDPGNPDNSFLLDKLRGKLDSGEGARMPLGLKSLKGSRIRLIEDWIAAGAPATGFVSTLGCQP
jgi:hypothetical protein